MILFETMINTSENRQRVTDLIQQEINKQVLVINQWNHWILATSFVFPLREISLETTRQTYRTRDDEKIVLFIYIRSERNFMMMNIYQKYLSIHTNLLIFVGVTLFSKDTEK